MHLIPATGLMHMPVEYAVSLTATALEKMYGVHIRLTDVWSARSTDGFEFTVMGRYINVHHFIDAEFGSNETRETIDDFVDMHLGDKAAEERWNRS
jgi:hypothetical protein